MTWVRPELFAIIPLACAMLFASEWCGARRRTTVLAALGKTDPTVRPTASVLVLGAAIAMLGTALAGPARSTSDTVVEPGADVMLALDVSRSMTVSDVAPRRAELARLAGLRISAALPGRVGLVAFADQAHLLLPPTRDRELLALYLESLDPQVVSGQGSDLARTIQVSLDALEARGTRDRPAAVVLITDGEGFQTDADLNAAVGRAGSAGIPVHALQVGTEAGGPVPGVIGARSASRPAVLERVAASTEGRWADVRDRGAVDAVADALMFAGGVSPEPSNTLSEALLLMATVLIVGHGWWARRGGGA